MATEGIVHRAVFKITQCTHCYLVFMNADLNDTHFIGFYLLFILFLKRYNVCQQ